MSAEDEARRMADWLEADANWGHLAPALREVAAEIVRLRAELGEAQARNERLTGVIDRLAAVPDEIRGVHPPPWTFDEIQGRIEQIIRLAGPSTEEGEQ